jgi:hypothetical protein
MGETTVLRNLGRIKPRSETQFRRVIAMAHRIRGRAGDEAWARMHEQAVADIRSGHQAGDSLSLCPECVKKGVRVITMHMGDHRRCGSCGWTREVDPDEPQ